MRTGLLVAVALLSSAGLARAQAAPTGTAAQAAPAAQGAPGAPAAAGAPAAPAPPKPGSIGGRVMLAPGVPASACQASIDSASLNVSCTTGGAFSFKEVPPGSYDVHVTVPNVGEAHLAVGAGPGQATYVGDVTIGVLGAVSGQVSADNSSDLDLTVIGVPELGVYTQPNVSGGYFLAGIPAGTWNVTIYPPGQNSTARSVTVLPGQPVRKTDFQIGAQQPPSTSTSTPTPAPTSKSSK
jgi:hypothetical protein